MIIKIQKENHDFQKPINATSAHLIQRDQKHSVQIIS